MKHIIKRKWKSVSHSLGVAIICGWAIYLVLVAMINLVSPGPAVFTPQVILPGLFLVAICNLIFSLTYMAVVVDSAMKRARKIVETMSFMNVTFDEAMFMVSQNYKCYWSPEDWDKDFFAQDLEYYRSHREFFEF